MAEQSGVVDSWNDEKRIGFVRSVRDGYRKFFVHYQSILDGDSLEVDEDVMYTLKEVVHKGRVQKQAVNVRGQGAFFCKSRAFLERRGMNVGVAGASFQDIIAAKVVSTGATVKQVERIGSYSSSESDPTLAIRIPAVLPVATAPAVPFPLEKDRYEPKPPSTRTLWQTAQEVLPPDVLSSCRVLADRNVLMNLMRGLDVERAHGYDSRVFRVDAERTTAGCLVLSRVELADPVTHMPVGHVLGSGFAFERLCTGGGDGIYEKHHVFSRVELGDFFIALRAEVDAADENGEDLELKTLNADYDQRMRFSMAAIQMRLGGCGKLHVGWHQGGILQEIQQLAFAEVAAMATGWDSLFGKLEGLLQRLWELSEKVPKFSVVFSPPERGSLVAGSVYSLYA